MPTVSLPPLSLLLEEGLLDDLLVTLVKDGRLLLVVEALEVVGLDSVRGQHRLLGGRVLGHEIIGQSKIHLMGLLVRPVLPLSQLGVTLLLGELQVVLLGGTEHGGAHHELDIVGFQILYTGLEGMSCDSQLLTLMQTPMDWLSGALMMRK